MDALHSVKAGLVPRLLVDAERHAAERRVREAYVLLRWASRITPSAAIPALLLAYHRIRAARPREGAAPPEPARDVVSPVPPPPHCLSESTERVEHDALGFPVPRFPTRAPELDNGAFIPAPRVGESPSRDQSPAASSHPRPTRRAKGGAVAVLVLVALTAVALSPRTVRQLGGHFSNERTVAARAEEALRAGEAARALALTGDTADPTPEVLLIRARALLALEDAAAAAATLRAASAHRLASGSQAGEAARLLAAIPGHEHDAAEAYLRALATGLPRERWPAAADALQRAGRRNEALRLRDLLPTSPSSRTRRSSRGPAGA